MEKRKDVKVLLKKTNLEIIEHGIIITKKKLLKVFNATEEARECKQEIDVSEGY